MLIGIDGNEANITNRVGVNVYAFELIRSLHKLQGEWKDKHEINVYLKDRPLSDLPNETECFKYKIIPGRRFWILTRLTPSLILDTPKPDVFLTPSHYVPILSPMPRLCTIMDLGYLEFSGQFKFLDYWQLKLWSAYSIYVSKAIIAISNSTKGDIVRHYPPASKKVFVTHLAYDKARFNQKILKEDVRRVKTKYSIDSDYVLYLGTLKPSKNIESLIKAFSAISRQFSDICLVIAGKKGWLYESIYRKARDLNLEKKVIFTDFISEEDKPGLIKGAKVFVLPSLWEGFGLDVLNAMACGIPVVVSRVGSLPEVAGEAGIYVNPSDTESIGRGIKKVLSLGKLEYNKLVEKGFRQVAGFSWEKTARETIRILEEL